MIYLIPFLNAMFGWAIISSLFYFLFHPHEKKNFFIFDIQGFIPKNLSSWSKQLGTYVSENVVNIPRMKESLLKGEQLSKIHRVLEDKVDDFLRNKLKDKIPVLSMFMTEGLITKMKEILVTELEHMVPSVIDQIAAGVEEQFNIQRMIDEKVNAVSTVVWENLFYQHAAKGIWVLRLSVALMGFALGWLEIWLGSV